LKIAIVFSDSPGCNHDVAVLHNALAPHLKEGRDVIIPRPVPWEAINWNREETEKRIQIDFKPDCVFFIEAVIDHSALLHAKSQILLPNPEYVANAIVRQAQRCSHIWHKSRVSLEQLASVFRSATHSFVGFSSIDPGKRVTDYTSFLHAKGNSWTRRNTDAVLSCWIANPDWPCLSVMSHSGEELLKFPYLSSSGNIRLQSGWLDRDYYVQHLSSSGVHLCISEVEGFGHYLNEARAMGALIVTTDGPPMNELVDTDSGLLVTPRSTAQTNFGTRHFIHPNDLASAVRRILGLDLPSRQRLGAAARHRFEFERTLFHQRVFECFSELSIS
jgi:glycosyltransferase involved in cell wall biosynthesis